MKTYTPDEFAAYVTELGFPLASGTVRKWCRAGKIGTRIGTRWYLTDNDLPQVSPTIPTPEQHETQEWIKDLSRALQDTRTELESLKAQRGTAQFLPVEVPAQGERVDYEHVPPQQSVTWYDDRYYRVQLEHEVRFLPSVTTILKAAPKPFLDRMRGDLGNNEMDRRMREAADRGTRIHDACGTLALGGVVLYQTPVAPFTVEAINELREKHGRVSLIYQQEEMVHVMRFHRWLEAVKPRISHVELTVFSLENDYAGTLDFIFEIEPGSYEINGSKPLKLGGRYIADLKTGKVISHSYHMQTAAYQRAMEETGLHVDGRLIIHTGAETRSAIPGLATHVRDASTIDDDWQDFLSTQRLWRRENAHSKPKIFDIPTFLNYNNITE